MYVARYEPKNDKGYDIHREAFAGDDWDELLQYFPLLRPFKSLTKHMEGAAKRRGAEGSHCALWESLRSMDLIYSHLEKTADLLEGYKDTEQWNVFSNRVDAGRIKLNEYYSLMDQSPAYCVALFLHPKYHFDYFEEQWADHKDWITKARIIIRETYERYEKDWLRKEKEKEKATQPKEAEVELSGGTVEEGDFGRFGRVTGAAYRRKRRRIENKLDAYMNAGVSDADQQVEPSFGCSISDRPGQSCSKWLSTISAYPADLRDEAVYSGVKVARIEDWWSRHFDTLAHHSRGRSLSRILHIDGIISQAFSPCSRSGVRGRASG